MGSSRVEDALEEVEALRGWRAFLLLPPEAADAQAIIDALPWVEQGAPRPGTLVRLFQVNSQLAVVTGGALTDEEGATLFTVRDQLKDILVRAFIIPPPTAAHSLITKMYESGLAPRMPDDKLPNWRGFAGLGTVFLMGVTVLVRSVRKTGIREDAVTTLSIAIAILAALAAICGLVAFLKNRKLNDILSDPIRIVQMSWSLNLPPLTARR